VSYLPQVIDAPAVLINREPVTCAFSAELLGDCDDVCAAIERELGWRDDGRAIAEFRFTPPNKFLLPSGDGAGTRFVETGRSMFLVTPRRAGESGIE
jgi:NAD-dependent histone deacetylase SIR2/NAD-dependent deacetylase sirtuin 1